MIVEKSLQRQRETQVAGRDVRLRDRDTLPTPTEPSWVTPEPESPPQIQNLPEPEEELPPGVDITAADTPAPTDEPEMQESAIETLLAESPMDDPEEASVEEEEAPGGGLVINEIMFYPMPRGGVEPTEEEFVELVNDSEVPIALRDYQFTRGIAYTFPDITIEPGGYVIVSPNATAFAQRYPDCKARVIGPWEGRLSNGGEELRLENADGEVVDRVAYADEGDWAVRGLTDRVPMSQRSSFSGNRHFSRGGVEGWVWLNAADGEGASLELISSQMSNNQGQNWAPSPSLGGSPGRGNERHAGDIAPLISGVTHKPAVPKPNQKVLILAEIDDVSQEAIEAQVYWRVSGYRDGGFQSVAMQPLSRDRFAAVLPGHPDKTVVEFYIRATDGQHERAWPANADARRRANALYQVDSETNRTAMAFYRLIMTEQEASRFGDNPHTNAEQNTTLIADDGSGPIIRYLCGTRVRGAGSRNNYPRPMRVNLPSDRPWNGATRMNLNSVYPWLQFIGMKIFQHARLPAPNMLPVQVRRNGRDETRKRMKDYGAFVHAQPLNGQFLDEHLPHDDGGNLYKKVRPDNSWSWHNGYIRGYQNDGWLKRSNASDNDWSDLDRFLGVMTNAPRERDYLQRVAEVMDIDQWLRYLAVMALMNNGEGGIANGIDDDYAIYRGVQDTRFIALPHDLDTILGVDESPSDPTHTLFDFVSRGNELEPLVPLFAQPEIQKRYFEIMAELIQTTFSNQSFGALLDQHLEGWVPQSMIEEMKDFMQRRIAYAAMEIQDAIERPSPLPAPTTQGTWESAIGKVVLNEVLAMNVRAHAHGETYPDLIELRNTTTKALSLGGMSLSDDPEKPGKFIFPEETSLKGKGTLVLYADQLEIEGELHTGFALKQEGETLTLYDRAGADGRRAILDSVVFGPQVADYSISRSASQPATWTLTKPSIGEPNGASVPLASPSHLRINEWLGAPEARALDDFVEIFNTSKQVVALGGMAVTNHYMDAPDEHRLPPLSFLGPEGLLLMESLGKASSQRHPCDLPFRLGSHHGWIRLVAVNDVEIDKVHYHCHRPDVSQGRLPNGSGNIAYLTLPSPGKANMSARDVSAHVRGLVLGLRVSEIMYHPKNPELEFIEFTNVYTEAIDLAGVRLTNGVTFAFEEGMLEPGAFLVLVNNQEVFRSHYGEEVRIGGQFDGKLSNGGETLEVRLPDPSKVAIQRFQYNDNWYGSTDGRGHSLTVLDARVDVKRWGDISNWRPSPEEGGSPGK